MKDRDRFVELLKDFKIKCNKFTCERNYNCQAHGFEQFADYLIANGVDIPVRCEECIYQKDCAMRITHTLSRQVHTTKDYVLEQNVSTYNKVYYCSKGKRKETGDDNK